MDAEIDCNGGRTFVAGPLPGGIHEMLDRQPRNGSRFRRSQELGMKGIVRSVERCLDTLV